VARKSKIKRRRQLSGILLSFAAIAVVVSVRDFRSGNSGAGLHILSPACLAAAALLAFVLPVRCRVTTRQRTPCMKWAYGVYLGCGDIPGHKLAKLYWRLGIRREPVTSAVPATAARQAARYPHPEAVATDTVMAKCGFLLTVISTVIGIAGLILELR
jgi:hypothetical protein